MKINNESLPIRCEICHKTDKFNKESNHCDRCNNIKPLINNKLKQGNYLNQIAKTVILTFFIEFTALLIAFLASYFIELGYVMVAFVCGIMALCIAAYGGILFVQNIFSIVPRVS
jgi:hypothetical protein